ncbi:MAG: MerR family transcriptional regulator [bacterium]|nr:MerR family transcriptional regulator [bacterium]
MYRIGEFSYLYKLIIKTLRYYDEIDLFKPSYKEPYTGYRYYSEDQKEELEHILTLKDYGFTLEEIKDLKKELTEEKIIQKIQELQQQQDLLDSKIKKLEVLKNGGENKMKYKVGFDSNKKINVIGIRINLEKRNQEELDKYFENIEKKVKKLKLNTKTKVVITEEVGYKEEDIELFIGYFISNLTSKEISKINKSKDLDLFSYPTADYLVAINLENDDIVTACKDIIEYSEEKKVQIIGPFMEFYDIEEMPKVYVMVHDLIREELNDERIKEFANDKYNEPFVLNKELLGKWKIKEILSNINFNPNKQKSNPSTTYMILEFYDDRTTNFENVTWSDKYIFIMTEHGVIANSINIMKINNKEYLEIRMNDMSSIYYRAKPISYIYEK